MSNQGSAAANEALPRMNLNIDYEEEQGIYIRSFLGVSAFEICAFTFIVAVRFSQDYKFPAKVYRCSQ